MDANSKMALYQRLYLEDGLECLGPLMDGSWPPPYERRHLVWIDDLEREDHLSIWIPEREQWFKFRRPTEDELRQLLSVASAPKLLPPASEPEES